MIDRMPDLVATLWSGFDLFTPSGRAAAALLLLRISGVMWTAPLFSSKVMPMSVKAALTVLLVALLLPVAEAGSNAWSAQAMASGAASAPAGAQAMASGAAATSADLVARFTVATAVTEVLIGMILGLGAAIFVAAGESAGDMLAVQMGLSGANVLDPMSQTQMPVLGQFLGLFVLALILSVGGHLVILGALADTLRLLPVGAPVDLAGGPLAALRLGGALLLMGVRFAAPVVAAMMIGNAALGVLARTVPQLNVLTVAFPVQIGLGLVVLGASLPLIAGALGGFGDAYLSLTSDLMGRLAPGAAGVR